ncbi:MAG: glycoside hydrolase family protein [bacterium]
MVDLEEQLILHEGLRLKPYKCTAGKLTIGVGRNLEDKGLTVEESLYLLKNDIEEKREQLKQFDWFNKLNFVRRKVIIDMAFNLGLDGLLKFKNMISAIKDGDYYRASKEMKDSLWYKQVGVRGKRLVKMMRSGKDYK